MEGEDWGYLEDALHLNGDGQIPSTSVEFRRSTEMRGAHSKAGAVLEVRAHYLPASERYLRSSTTRPGIR